MMKMVFLIIGKLITTSTQKTTEIRILIMDRREIQTKTV